MDETMCMLMRTAAFKARLHLTITSQLQTKSLPSRTMAENFDFVI